MRPVGSAVGEDLLVVAAGVDQGVGQNGKAVEGSVIVNGAGEGDDIRGPPARAERCPVERIAEDVPDEPGLGGVIVPEVRRAWT